MTTIKPFAKAWQEEPGPRHPLRLLSELSGMTAIDQLAANARRWHAEHPDEPILTIVPGSSLFPGIYQVPDILEIQKAVTSASFVRASVQKGFAPIIGYVLSGEGETYEKVRDAFVETLSSEAVERYLPRIQATISSHVATWRGKYSHCDEMTDIVEDVSALYRTLVHAMLFGGQGIAQFWPITNTIISMMPSVSRFSVLEVLRAHLPAPVVIYAATRLLGFTPQEYIDYSEQKAYLDSQFTAFFDDMFKLPPSAWAAYGYLGKILARVDQGILTRDEAQAEITGFFIAAQETTSSATSWGLMHLAKNPTLFREVRQEIQMVLGQRAFESKDMNSLPLTMSVLYEVIRMYPPAENLLRQTTSTYTIANTTIPAGAMVLFSLTEAFRNPYIFTEPEVFNPKRFESKELRDLVRLAWAVGDVHVCKGMLLSMAQFCAVIVTVCRQTTALWMEGAVPQSNHGGSQHPDSAKGGRWYATWDTA